jgi:hypothetical protein
MKFFFIFQRLRVLFAFGILSYFTNAEIFISKSTNRLNPVLLNSVPCISRGNYIFLNQTQDDSIYKVTWYTKTSLDSIERYNIKTDYYWPYDFKSGTNLNADVWDTTDTLDGEYLIYTNIYRNGSISERFKETFLICNDYNFIISNNMLMNYAQFLDNNTVINSLDQLYLAVVPYDNIVNVTLLYDKLSIPSYKQSNLILASVTNFTEHILDFFDNNTSHLLEAKINLITDAKKTLSIKIPPALYIPP